MADNAKTNSWDDLLQDLGAKPDETAFERKQPAPQEIPPTVEWSEAEEAAESETSPSDWGNLAESLGLEIDDSPAPVVEEVAKEVREEKKPAVAKNTKMEAPAAEVVDDTTEGETADNETADNSAFGGFLAPKAEKVAKKPVKKVVAKKAKEVVVEEVVVEDEADEVAETDELPPLPTQMDQALSENAWEDESEEGSTESAEEGDIDANGISGEAARSAFDALFSDGASTWGSAFLDKPKQAKVDDVESKQTDSEQVSPELAESVEAKASGEDEDGERPKRKRSRRRRRGGRGRKPAGERTAEGEGTEDETAKEQTSDEESDSDRDELSEEVSTEGKTKKPRRRRSRRRPRSAEAKEKDEKAKDDSDLDDVLQDDDADDDNEDIGLSEGRSSDSPRGRQRHRNLPTWSEAIGMIVDTNLEQRAKSPSKPQSSRGGRGRGGRRRGGGGGGGRKSEKS